MTFPLQEEGEGGGWWLKMAAAAVWNNQSFLGRREVGRLWQKEEDVMQGLQDLQARDGMDWDQDNFTHKEGQSHTQGSFS